MDRNHFKNVISDYFIVEKLIFTFSNTDFFKKKVLKMTQKVSILFRLDPFFAEKFRFCSG